MPEFNKYLPDNTVKNSIGGLALQEGADFLGARMFSGWTSALRW